jgi:hypothetical protein
VQAATGCSDEELVDALIELLIDLAGEDSAEAQAIRQRWVPNRSVFGGRRGRALRRAIREGVLGIAG